MTKLLRLTVLMLCCIASITTSNAYVVSEQDAYEAVVQSLVDKVHHFNISITESNDMQWLVVVDPNPYTILEHDYFYYYIDKDETLPITLNKVISTQSPFPITSNSNGIAETSQASIDEFDYLITPNIPHSESYDNINTYAVIINGGMNTYNNHHSYWNNCAFMYATLKHIYHIPQNNIYIAMSDGDNPSDDSVIKIIPPNTGSGTVPIIMHTISSPLDLDGDGINDLKYSATKDNLLKIFTELGANISRDSHLLVFITDHGGINNESTCLWLWNNTKLFPQELKEYLDKVDCTNKTVVLGQCFSGGFIDALADDGTVIMTAATADKTSHAKKFPEVGAIYDKFELHFTSAISGYEPIVKENYDGQKKKYYVSFTKTVNADTNGDGFVSMKEAFDYAIKNNQDDPDNYNPEVDDDPQYRSTPEYLGEEAGLDRVVMPVCIRDDFADDGIQPNTNTTEWWYSPDVWLRPSDDGRTEPYYPESMDNVSTLYAYARVTNCGWKDRPAKGYVHFYYDLSSLGTDKTTWSGGFYYNGRTIGGYIGKAALPEIDVWDDAIVSCKWDVSPVAKLYDLENIGILAIISDSATRPYYPVADNAEILGKRSVAYHSASARSLGSIFSTKMSLTNPSNSAETFSLGLSPQFYDYSWDTSLFDHADVRIIITNPTAASGWTANGKKGNNYTIMSSDPLEIRLNSFSSNICGIPVNGRSILPVTMKITPKNSQSGTAFSLTQTQESTNKIIGGHTFKLTPTFQFHVLIDAQEEAGTCNSLLTAVLPDDTDTDNVSYRWTNSKGDILSEEQTLRVPVSATEEETYSVNVQKDEESGMASITIENEPVMSLGACTKERIPVSLTKELDSRYTITVSSPVQGRTKTIIVNPGETQYDIPFESNGNEVITVSLSDSNSTIQSIKTIVK